MKKDFKIFTEELKTKFLEFLQSDKTKDTLEKIKASNDSGHFKVVISTDYQDRQGEVIEQAGADVSFYKMNPIVLWAHDYGDLPIGMCNKIELIDGKWMAEGIFAPEEANPFAQQVRRLYDGGFIKATSIGFIPKRLEGNVIKEWELLEFSFVPVPANPFALSLEKAGFKVSELITCGLFVKADEPKEGDACTMEDGAEGTMQLDGDGKLSCTPKKVEEKKTEQKGEVTDQLDEEQKRRIKSDNLRAMDNILYAFWDVYLDEKTEPAQFGPLLKEVIQLLAALVPADTVQASIVAEQVKLIDEKKIENILVKRWVDVMKEKSGKVLSEKNRTLISSCVDGMKQSIAALDELIKATEPQGDEGKSAKTDDPNKRSSGAEFDTKQALDMVLFSKQVLRLVSTTVGDALSKINKNTNKK